MPIKYQENLLNDNKYIKITIFCSFHYILKSMEQILKIWPEVLEKNISMVAPLHSLKK